jgi:hypothetical protein
LTTYFFNLRSKANNRGLVVTGPSWRVSASYRGFLHSLPALAYLSTFSACSDANTNSELTAETFAPAMPSAGGPIDGTSEPGSSAAGTDAPAAAPAPAAMGTGQEAPIDLSLAPPDTGAPGSGSTPTTNAPPATTPEPTSNGPLPLVFGQENTGADCPAVPVPTEFAALEAIPNLPDPFLLMSGTRLSSRDQWRCRRNEIGSLIQFWGTGPKGTPPSELTATFSGNELTVVVTHNGASITLSSTLNLPNGPGPFPLMIGMNTPTGSLPADLFAGVATMAFDDSQLTPNDFSVPRGAGTYFSMYPDANTGAMIEWAWGVSRLIDGLYKTAEENRIDLKHIGVTGCSFQGKMALYAGAFDERIALVIPEESGGGGEASWRFMATQTGTEDLEAAQGTAWYARNLLQFDNADAPRLPFDMHELVAMVAPRAILAVHNTGIDRLGSQAGSVSMRAAAEVYEALGIPDRIGFTQTVAPAHCSFPANIQGPDVRAFLDKFLLDEASANTSIARDSYDTDLGQWVTWSTPDLK